MTAVEPQAAPATSEEPWVKIEASGAFSAFLKQQNISLAFTTYQAGKLFLVGRNGDRLAVFERTFNRSMGLCQHRGALRMQPHRRAL